MAICGLGFIVAVYFALGDTTWIDTSRTAFVLAQLLGILALVLMFQVYFVKCPRCHERFFRVFNNGLRITCAACGFPKKQ